MPDETLIGEDLRLEGKLFLEPYDESCVQGASYDLRVGSTVIVAHPKEAGGVKAYSLDAIPDSTIDIPPGNVAIVRSLEKLSLPNDIKGRLSLRSFHATRYLGFHGGMIDPGYNGYLFFPIWNNSASPVKLEYGDSLITAEFVRLGKSAEPYEGGREVLNLPEDRLPEAPSREIYDTIDLNNRLDEFIELAKELQNSVQNLGPGIAQAQAVLNTVLLGAAAGIVAAVAFFAFQNTPFPGNIISATGAIALGIIFLIVYTKARRNT